MLTLEDRDQVISAVEHNPAAWFRTMLPQVPGAWLSDTPEMLCYRTGVPMALLNGVACANLDGDVASTVRATVALFDEPPTPMGWWVGPATHPAGLGRALAEEGLVSRGDIPCLAFDLAASPACAILRHRVVRAASDEDVEQFLIPLASGFELTPACADVFGSGQRGLGYSRSVPLQSFTAYLDERPAACASVFLACGVAGIYCVATDPDCRRQGCAAAAVAATLDWARDRGFRTAILHATEMGYPVYRRMGFVDVCTMQLYVRA